MDQQENDLRTQLFPNYKKTGAPAASGAPVTPGAPAAAPATPPKFGSTFVFSAHESEPTPHFGKLFFVNFLLAVASFCVTLVQTDSVIGQLVFLLFNPISYFVVALVVSILCGVIFHFKKNAEKTMTSFTYTKALVALYIMIGILGSVVYFALF